MSGLLGRLFPGRSKRSTVTISTGRALSDLSDSDLLCLMDILPLEDLMRLGCTNHRFNQLAKRRQPGRRHLLLVIGSKSSESDEQNVITVPALTFTLVDRILSKLPSIVNLHVYNGNSAGENIEPITYLLGCLSTQLQKLKLTFKEAFRQPTSQRPLFAAINHLGKLTSLNLNYKEIMPLLTDDEPAILHLPIITQLVDFQFYLLNTSAQLVLLQLIELATASAPTEIRFGAYFDVHSLDLLLDIAPELASRFIKLSVYYIGFNSAHLENICDHFSNLTSLAFNSSHLTIRQISLNLAKLPHLSDLKWIIDFHKRTLWRQPDVALARFGELAEPDVIDSADLVPLPAVTKLVLCLLIDKHNDLALLHLGTLFPKVISLEVSIWKCVQCRYSMMLNDYEIEDRCLAKLIKYWHALPQLQQLAVKGRVVPESIWKPLPLLGVSRFQLRQAIQENLVDPVNKITTWITSKFTSA